MSHLPSLAPDGRLALSELELISWGERFGKQLKPPTLVTLSGELGAGKTTLVRAICVGYGVSDDVTSPTFAIVHEYSAPRSPVYHVDLYRLEREHDLQNIGWDEIVSAEAIVLVEWPERAGAALPAGHIPLELRHVPGDGSRRVLYAGGDLRYAASDR